MRTGTWLVPQTLRMRLFYNQSAALPDRQSVSSHTQGATWGACGLAHGMLGDKGSRGRDTLGGPLTRRAQTRPALESIALRHDDARSVNG